MNHIYNKNNKNNKFSLKYIMVKQTRKESKGNNKNNTRKSRKESYEVRIIKKFMTMLNMVKLFHWKTLSYPAHKATDKLHEKLNEHIDRYVEVMMGSRNSKLNMKDFKNMKLENLENKKELEKYINKTKKEMLEYHKELNENIDVGLMAIRDEIIADLNRFLYLLRLK
jgi:hypothetical protein